MVVLTMLAQVICDVVDSLRQNRDLHSAEPVSPSWRWYSFRTSSFFPFSNYSRT